MNTSLEPTGAFSALESSSNPLTVELSPESIFRALDYYANEHRRRPQLCGLCMQGWAVDPSLLCATCITVDDLLAAAAGSQHFLPHIWSNTLQGQPSQVMSCTLRKLHFPDSTGFYGVYTTMYRILSHRLRTRRAEAIVQFAEKATPALDIAASLQPSHVKSFELLVSQTHQLFPVVKSWLDGVVDQVRLLCEQRDADSPVTLTDFQRAQIAMVLR